MERMWIDDEVWQRVSDPDPHATRFVLVTWDPDLGALVVARTPDGREVYGADSPRSVPEGLSRDAR